MNVSSPLPSQIQGLDFGFLSRAEIRKLSVKRIHHTEAINRDLGFPVPGGLYDQALGTRGEYSCTTCNLRYLCPGHAGHIELPTAVYHPVFLDQLMKLLNSQCGCCFRFRMSAVELHAFASKLKLLRYGLVEEAHEIDSITLSNISSKDDEISDNDGNDETSGMQNQIIRLRNRFMAEAMKRHGGKRQLLSDPIKKVESLVEERRVLVKEFLFLATKPMKCGHCGGYSSKYRKDGFNKIFKKPLRKELRAANAQHNIKPVDPMLARAKVHEEAQAKKRKHLEVDEDEGIAMEVDDFSAEESDGEELLDTAISTSDMIDSVAMASGTVKEARTLDEAERQELITPAMALARMEELFREEAEFLGLFYQSRTEGVSSGTAGPEMFFMFDILVTPNKYRPDMKTGAGMITEADQNKCYSDIINASVEYADASRSLHGAESNSPQYRKLFDSFQRSLIKVQDSVNSLIDSDRNTTTRGLARAPEGIKQKLEKKEGLFRMNMMGKRVNFAARSVISPDPNIEANEIGVPPVFAKKLTYPEPVTNHNFYEMKQAVLNGPEKWPGAATIENENGQLINLKFKNYEERQALANQLLAPSSTISTGARNKKVHRHLNNGDIVIMNRQPTLHKPSMMCHRARILPGEKTIRMHYANCKTYNADFDGDEMNMHFPQNESARAEAIFIADTNHQYLSATAGEPLRGLIQDHLSMGVWLTNKDSFFSRGDYHELLYSCLRPEKSGRNIVTLPPTLLKPKPLWTGKQLVSTILSNIKPDDHPGLTLTGKSQVAAERWTGVKGNVDKLPTEGEVRFKDGQLLCGILDKAQLGPAKGGFVHAIYEIYGEVIAGSLLSILGRMLTKLEHMRAFSCGIEDIAFTKAGNQRRHEMLKGCTTVGHEVATKYVTLPSSVSKDDRELESRLEEVLRDDKKQQGLDTVYNSRTKDVSSGITKECLPFGLVKPFPRNQMQTMTVSGAKGSAVNANLISCNLGQQVLEGRRTPTMVSGKTLPAFNAFETAIRAGGYITNRFLTGVYFHEYFFHTMAGREGLIDTAVKTSRSGYLQRCIIKGMEGLQVEYDTTVRDSDGSMIQFLYGEDGLDVTKQAQLSNFKFQAENWGSSVQNLKLAEIDPNQYKTDIADANQKAIRKYHKTDNLGVKDPVLSLHNPSSTWGCASEKFTDALKTYMKKNPERLIKDKKTNPDGVLGKKEFQMLLEMMYMRSVIEPGEPVGIVAGQSIGEPSTQMTLNTFHLAGHSAKNVTLGIPRLREIVMTATANLATPQMKVYLNDEISDADGERFAKGLTKRTVADMVDKITITEKVGKGAGYARAKLYEVRLEFYPSDEYKETYAITEEDLARAIELSLIPNLDRAIRREIKDKDLARSGKSQSQPIVGNTNRTKSNEHSIDAGSSSNQDGSGDQDGEKDDETNALSEDSDSNASDSEDEDSKTEGKAYDNDEEDEKIAEAAREGSKDPDERASQPLHEDEGYVGSPQDSSDNESDTGSSKQQKPSGLGKVTVEMAKERSSRIVGGNNPVSKFKWDIENSQWCTFCLEFDMSIAKILMLHLVEAACHKAVVQSITNIESATLDKEKIHNDETGDEKDVSVIIVEGNNLVAMQDHQAVINPHRIFTNDIVAMMNTYGVEAGRATIIREMNAVFEGHSIAVDNRHLNLIADHMTRSGSFLAFSRTGMKSGVSPLAKMSFETTVGFLKDAVLENDFDNLRGPSARIVIGKPSKVGTGAFDVLTPIR